MELGLQEDIAEANLKVLADLSPQAGTSMQRDIAKGGASEIEGLVYGMEKMASASGQLDRRGVLPLFLWHLSTNPHLTNLIYKLGLQKLDHGN